MEPCFTATSLTQPLVIMATFSRGSFSHFSIQRTPYSHYVNMARFLWAIGDQILVPPYGNYLVCLTVSW